jgi:hypothetical protein
MACGGLPAEALPGLFVGDPGQLDPFSVQTARWTGLTWDPDAERGRGPAAPQPDVPVHTLPVSWRLPASAAPVVAEAFYPFTGFREFDIVIVLHPLSGRRDATAFHLEAGRLCVLTTRHRHACIVVARAGIPELLDAHPSAEPVHLNVPVKFPDGWEANQSLLAHLSQFKVRAS